MFPTRHFTRSRLLMQRKRLQMVEGARPPFFCDPPVPIIYSGGEPFPPTKRDVMQNLRERGIYALPDGREFVVHAVFRGGYVFYTPQEWEVFGPHAFESDAEGHLRWSGQTNHWSIEDLIDTNRTALSRSRSHG